MQRAVADEPDSIGLRAAFEVAWSARCVARDARTVARASNPARASGTYFFAFFAFLAFFTVLAFLAFFAIASSRG
jgi:hypothetical protein